MTEALRRLTDVSLAQPHHDDERHPEQLVADLVRSGAVSSAEGAALVRRLGSGDEGGYDAAAQYDKALDILKSLADQELERGQRLSATARQAFAFGAGFFGVTQVAAIGALKELSSGQDQATLICAVVAAVSVVMTALLAIKADALRSVRNLSSDDVLKSVNASIEQEAPASYDLSELYARAFDERAEAVESRKPWLLATQIAAVFTVLVLAGELILTLVARL